MQGGPGSVWFSHVSSKTKASEELGASGYRPKILLLKKPKWCSVSSIEVIGKSALEIGQFLSEISE